MAGGGALEIREIGTNASSAGPWTVRCKTIQDPRESISYVTIEGLSPPSPEGNQSSIIEAVGSKPTCNSHRSIMQPAHLPAAGNTRGEMTDAAVQWLMWTPLSHGQDGTRQRITGGILGP